MERNPAINSEILEFASQLVRIKSYSGQEETAIKLAKQKMEMLGFDDVKIDAMGNVIGSIGEGEQSILFDSHLDTVEVQDAESWDFDPFGGAIINGKLCGRGSIDMKSSAAASIYAAWQAKEGGLLKGKKVYVSCTVFEEDCDGVTSCPEPDDGKSSEEGLEENRDSVAIMTVKLEKIREETGVNPALIYAFFSRPEEDGFVATNHLIN